MSADSNFSALFRSPVSDAEHRAIAYLYSPQAIRERCSQVFQRACADQGLHFRCQLDALDAVVDAVIEATQHHYPDFKIPVHSRWRHFEVGGLERLDGLDEQLQQVDPLEAARSRIDLAVVSVLLDAGAGELWHYHEHQTGQVWQRSEGLAIASFHMFCAGAFSSVADQPLRVDAAALLELTMEQLEQGFQVSSSNPLVGLEGRIYLLHRLGEALQQSPPLFGSSQPRPGRLVDHLMERAVDGSVPASWVLEAVLQGFSPIWPGRVTLAGVNLGDVWPHPALADTELGSNLVPFHKLSQWLTYSLLEPLQRAGLETADLDALTGLPEYRNGGLFVDLGVLQPKQPEVIQSRHLPGSSVIVEWRALTVMLLDQVAIRMRERLGLSAAELPLARVLQGGTWSAGRAIARDRRPGGVPPIQIESDGTVF